jgi:hypothetical protein
VLQSLKDEEHTLYITNRETQQTYIGEEREGEVR